MTKPTDNSAPMSAEEIATEVYRRSIKHFPDWEKATLSKTSYFLTDEVLEVANKYAAQQTAALQKQLEEKERELKQADENLELSEKAHDISLDSLLSALSERNELREICGKLLSEMKSAEWESPLMHEAETILNHTQHDTKGN